MGVGIVGAGPGRSTIAPGPEPAPADSDPMRREATRTDAETATISAVPAGSRI
jgi:hypothetical protein